MANNMNDAARRPHSPRRNRRKPGVPVLLAIVLVIMALLMGALGGFVVARKTDPHVHELQAAKDRVTELENTLTLIGYPLEDDVDPQQWLYDNTADDTALEDLTGAGWDEDADELWTEDSLLTGTLPEDGDPVVVAEFEGGELLSTEVIPAYNDQLTTQIFAGHDANEVAEATLSEVMSSLAADKIIAARARELGLTELTEEDLAEIDRQAAENYETQLSDYIAFVSDGKQSRESAAKQLAEESGVTLESITQSLKDSWWTRKFYDHVTKDVTVTDEEVQACYDALLAGQKETFTTYPEEFEYAHQLGQLIVYRPEGYRAVRDILIPFASDEDGETAAALTEQIELGTAEDGAQEQLTALYAPLEQTAQKAQDKLAAGADFAELMDEFGCDAALRDEPMRSEGYYVSDHSYINSVEYVEGSMMLEQPGQVSAPLRSAFGVHLVQYIGDVTPGEVPLADVIDAVREEALKQKRDAYYDQQRQAMLEEANVKYYPERLH